MLWKGSRGERGLALPASTVSAPEDQDDCRSIRFLSGDLGTEEEVFKIIDAPSSIRFKSFGVTTTWEWSEIGEIRS